MQLYLLIIKIVLFVIELIFQGTALLRVPYSYILHSRTFDLHNIGLLFSHISQKKHWLFR